MRKILYISMVAVITLFFASPLISEEEAAFLYDSKARRDPFVPLIAQSARAVAGLENIHSINDIALEGIVWDASGDSVAILNGVIMKEGQKTENVQIKNIKEKSITLIIDEAEYTINLIRKGDETGVAQE